MKILQKKNHQNSLKMEIACFSPLPLIKMHSYLGEKKKNVNQLKLS